MVPIYLSLVVLSLIFCLSARRIGHALGVLDVPGRSAHKRHRRITPLVGGIAFAVPVTIMYAYLAADTGMLPLYGVMAAAVVGFFGMGLLDDHRHIKPVLRLLLAIGVCVLALRAVPGLEIRFLRFSFLDAPVFLEQWSGVFTILCLVGLQNSVNMADGRSGVAIGLCMLWLGFLAFYVPSHMVPLLIAAALVLGVVLAFNLRERLFLGDSGSYAVSIMVGLVTIYAYNLNFVNLPADVVAIWFLIPVMDCLRLIVTRVLSGRSPLSPDRDHLHHLMANILPGYWTLVCYLALAALPSLVTVFVPGGSLFGLILAVAGYTSFLMLGRARAVGDKVSEGH